VGWLYSPANKLTGRAFPANTAPTVRYSAYDLSLAQHVRSISHCTPVATTTDDVTTEYPQRASVLECTRRPWVGARATPTKMSASNVNNYDVAASRADQQHVHSLWL